MWRDQALGENLRLNLLRPNLFSCVQSANSLEQRFFEGAAYGHHFPDGLHLGSQVLIGAGKLLKLPLGDFYDYVVQCRFEAGRSFSRDVVGNLI